MKSFLISVCILASFSGVFCGDYFPWKFGTCHRPELGVPLNYTQFFNGKWFSVKSVGNYLFQANGDCLTTETKLKENGKIDLLHYQYESVFGKYAYVRGTALSKYAKYMGAFFPVTYEALAGVYELEVPFSVVDTDYDNWAFVYFCKQFLGFKAEMAWMLSRNRTTDHLKELENAAKTIGMDQTQFYDQNNLSCRKENRICNFKKNGTFESPTKNKF